MSIVQTITVRYEGVTGEIVISARGLKPEELDDWWERLDPEERQEYIRDAMYADGITSSVKDAT